MLAPPTNMPITQWRRTRKRTRRIKRPRTRTRRKRRTRTRTRKRKEQKQEGDGEEGKKERRRRRKAERKRDRSQGKGEEEEEKTGISDQEEGQEEKIKIQTSDTVRLTGLYFLWSASYDYIRLIRYSFYMIHQLTNAKSDDETEDSKQPVGMRESSEKAKNTDYETIHINCMSSAKLVCERANTYSTE